MRYPPRRGSIDGFAALNPFYSVAGKFLDFLSAYRLLVRLDGVVSKAGGLEMAERSKHKLVSDDETEIRALIARWAEAVRNQDRAAIRAHHDADMLMFDVPPPFLSRGLDAYMTSWELFFSCGEKPVVFDFHDIEITAGADVAFATAIGNCINTDSKSHREPLQFRLTMGLRKIDGAWRIMHEHHSLPAVD